VHPNAQSPIDIDHRCFKCDSERLEHEKGKRTASSPVMENHEVAAGMNEAGNKEGKK